MKMTKNGRLGSPPKCKNFPNLMIFDQKAWTTAHENDQNVWFLKNTLFLRNFKIGLLGPIFIDRNSWNSKIWGKKRLSFYKNFMMLRSHSPCMFVFSSMWEEKKNCLTWKRKKQNHAQSAFNHSNYWLRRKHKARNESR